MRYYRRCQLLFILLIVTYFEFFVYRHNGYIWPVDDDSRLRPIISSNENTVREVWRWLIVSDPQLIGYDNEYFSLLTIFDCDRYLKRTFRRVKAATRPDLVVFLGDLFDEGSTSTQSDWQKTAERFQKIFNVDNLERIYILGDNDIGGEYFEPINQRSVENFKKNFISKYDLKKSWIATRANFDLYTFDKFLSKTSRLPLALPIDENRSLYQRNNSNDSIKVILSHAPLYTFYERQVKLIDSIGRPTVVLSAHNHKSYFVMISEEGQFHQHSMEPGSYGIALEINDKSNIIVELNTLTCSYRMGVSLMGYTIVDFEMPSDPTNNRLTMRADIIYLPSRLTHLKLYLLFGVALACIELIVYLIYSCNKQRRFRYMLSSFFVIL